MHLVMASEGQFTIDQILNFPMPMIQTLNVVLKEKFEAQKQAMEQAQGTTRRTF